MQALPQCAAAEPQCFLVCAADILPMAQRNEVKPMVDKTATNETASAVTEHDEAAARDESMQEALDKLDRMMAELGPVVREELKYKTDALTEGNEMIEDHCETP